MPVLPEELNRQAAKSAKFGTKRDEPSAHLDANVHAVIGAAIEVHRHLGPGFLEATYEDAMVVECRLRGIPVERQIPLPVLYKGHPIAESRIDLLVDGDLVVELKAVESLLPIHTAQVIAYLRAGAFDLGLLINFNVPLLKNGIRRIVCSSSL